VGVPTRWFDMSHRHRALLATSISILAGLTAGPASAATAPLTATGQYVRTSPFIDGTLYDIQCSAAAPGAVTTRIDSCKLINQWNQSYDAPPVTEEGSLAHTYYLVVIPTYQWKLCWTASATYGDGSTKATGGCTAVSPYAGTGESISE
jgi:hypothetical protein